VRRAVLSLIVLVVALMLQLTFVNRLPLPGGESGAGPDLVLLVVVALALLASPATGAATGFCAGLALDLAPPGSYLIGEYALVLCLVGYLCGRIRAVTGSSAVLTILAAMVAAAVGEGLLALLGRVVSDPQVTWPAVRHVLPPEVIYDVVLAPFVLYAVVIAVRWAEGLGRVSEGGVLLASAQAAAGHRPGATMLGGAGLLGGAGWLSGPLGARGRRAARRGGGHHPHAPRLRSAAARPGDGWIGGARRTGLAHPGSPRRPGRQPRLRPGPAPAARRAAGPAAHPGYAAARSAQFRPRRQPNLRAAARRHRDGAIGRSLGPAAGWARGGRAGGGVPGSAFRTHGPPAAGRGARPGVPLPRKRSGAARAFRPNPRLRGGSASRSGPAGRPRPARRSAPRLGTSRRHDGVLGGGAFGGGAFGRRVPGGKALSGKAFSGGGLGGRTPSGRSPSRGLRWPGDRGVSLHLGSRRRRDGTLGGLASHRKLWARRQAAPRFRSGPGFGRRLVLAIQARLHRRRRVRFNSGSRSFVASWTGGRLGSRSAVWRIGSKRTGGL
jgi:rod shape-determining protein MreD